MSPVPSISAFTNFPSAWPAANPLIVFGVLLALGVLGGLLAARVRWLPTITGFMTLGLVIGPNGIGLVSEGSLQAARPLVEVALGLILFRLGVTLHPVQALRDRWLVVTSLAEGLLTFIVVVALMLWVNVVPVMAILAGAIAVSSSPAVLVHVAQELGAKGPTVDGAKTLVAANNVLSFLLFSITLPFALRAQTFDLVSALLLPIYQMLGAVAVGLVVAWAVTRIGLLTRGDERHFRFALVVGAVTLALGLAVAFKVSTLFAGLSLGIACCWLQGESRLAEVELGEGADVFFVVLFVFAGASLHLPQLLQYAPIALALVAARTLTKVATVYACGKAFGRGHRQSVASGLLLVPMAGLAIGLVHTTSHLMPELGGRIAAIVLAAVAIFETVGPPVAAFALRLAGEAKAPVVDDSAAAAAIELPRASSGEPV